MPLTISRGNMYPWVTHCHSHLRGGCPHDCVYCYVKSFRNYKRDYTGPVRLAEKELRVDYLKPWKMMRSENGKVWEEPHADGAGKTIFIEHCNDMFAEGVPDEFVSKILAHCDENPGNTYVFQTKNPRRMWDWMPELPSPHIVGTTIETNYSMDCWYYKSKRFTRFTLAPNPRERYEAMLRFAGARTYSGNKIFLTIEPIMDFDIDVLSKWIIEIKPDFINIGADSKGHGLSEPNKWDVIELIDELAIHGIEVNVKHNLERLMK